MHNSSQSHSQKIFILVLAIALAGGVYAAAAPAAPSGDWPQWRGPKRDGVSPDTGLLKQWPAEGPKLAWKATGIGAGYSDPSVAGGKIYVMGELNGSASILALDGATGKPLWEAKIGKPGSSGGYAGARGTPTVDGNFVYGLGQLGELACVQTATGQVVWTKNLVADFKGAVPSWGYSESPLVDGNLVVCTPGGKQGAIVALNKTTGATVWQTKDFTDTANYSSLIEVEIGGARQYIQLTAQSVAGVAATTGQLLWRAPRVGKTAVIPTPIYADGEVFVTSGYGVGHNAFKVTAANGKFSAQTLYEGKEITNHHGGVVLVGQHIYGHSDMGGWTCMEFKTGKVVWTNPGVGKGAVTAADGHLYLRGEGKGTVALIEASPDGYKEKGRFEQPDRSRDKAWSHPVVIGGKLYLRDQDTLLCFNVKE